MKENKKPDDFLGLKWTENQLSQLENETAAENQKNLGMVSQVSVFFSASLLLISFFEQNSALRASRLTTGSLLAVSLLIHAYSQKIPSGKPKQVFNVSYLLLTALLVTGTLLGTVYSPDDPAVTFGAVALSVPLFFPDRPSRTLKCIAANLGFFILMAVLFDHAGMVKTDILNSILFSICSFFSSAHMSRTFARKMLYEKELFLVGDMDLLTGLKSRNSYQKALGELSGQYQEKLACVYADADGLHEINEQKGHDAGDQMLKSIAAAVRTEFGDKLTYRIGGDEFVAFATDAPEEEVKRKMQLMKKLAGEASYHVSAGYAITDRSNPDLNDLVRRAETGMYEDKRQYYLQSGKEWRDNRGSLESFLQTENWTEEERDSLTKLLTRDAFGRMGEALLKKEPQKQYHVIYFNIEHFKLFNTTCGRDAGDGLILYLARMLRYQWPKALICRITADHFAVMTDQAENLESSIMRLHREVSHYQNQFVLELKAGICRVEPGMEILTAIDNAHLSETSLRDRNDQVFCWYDRSEIQRMLARKKIIDTLPDAIREGKIVAYYQPQIRLLTGKLCGAEALSRWLGENYSVLLPETFIDVLENARIIHLLDLHICECACRDLEDLKKKGVPTVPVSINLSRYDFQLCDIFQGVDEIVKKHGLTPADLEIEVTESAFAESYDAMKESLQKFREAGYRIWMDDFGSGYSSMNVLKEVDFDVLKIDMKFLRSLSDEKLRKRAETIITSTIDMAKRLGIETLCEGAETSEHVAFLKDVGCEMVQGYYYSRPVPLEEFLKKGFSPETAEEARYGSIAGRINLLSGDESSSGEGWYYVIPRVLVEIGTDHFKCLACNSSFNDYLHSLDAGDAGMSEEQLNQNYAGIGDQYRHAADLARRSGKPVTFDTIINGEYCTHRLRLVAVNQESGAMTVLVASLNLSGFASSGRQEEQDKALRSIVAIFDRIDLLDYESGRVKTIHQTTGNLNNITQERNLSDAIRAYAEAYVSPEDRQKFENYYLWENVEADLSDGKNPCRILDFRGETRKGIGKSYSFQIPVSAPGHQIILSALLMAPVSSGMPKAVTAEQISSLRAETQSAERTLPIETDSILNSLLKLLPVGTFWKDRDRRFLGVNQAFLNFYGMKSVDEVLGKTDEDLGWHTDPDPYRNDEIRVIRDGVSVQNVPGRCIVQGEEHQIACTKGPIFQDGEISGLVGWFIDLTEEEKKHILPHSAESRSQEESSISRYIEASQKRGIDFAMISVKIENLSELKKKFGAEETEALLRTAEENLAESCGRNNVLLRSGNGRFMILSQVINPDSADAVRRK
ncbi:MAG: EAL domain-containing protein, partial [Bulleidia sp.]